jgi:hypothetical protein
MKSRLPLLFVLSLLISIATKAAAIPVELGNEAIFAHAAPSSFLTNLILGGMGCAGLTAFRWFRR